MRRLKAVPGREWAHTASPQSTVTQVQEWLIWSANCISAVGPDLSNEHSQLISMGFESTWYQTLHQSQVPSDIRACRPGKQDFDTCWRFEPQNKWELYNQRLQCNRWYLARQSRETSKFLSSGIFLRTLSYDSSSPEELIKHWKVNWGKQKGIFSNRTARRFSCKS